MGLLDIFNYGTGGSYYADQQKEIDKKYRTFPVAGGKVDMTIDRRNQNITGGSLPNQLPPGMQVPKPTQKPFHPSQGGIFNKDGTTLGKGDVSKDNLNFFSKLTGLNFKQLQGDFKKEGARVTDDFIEMIVDSNECVDIDTQTDFNYAEVIVNADKKI